MLPQLDKSPTEIKEENRVKTKLELMIGVDGLKAFDIAIDYVRKGGSLYKRPAVIPPDYIELSNERIIELSDFVRHHYIISLKQAGQTIR